ncbi:OprO/OprP family phosphate-selective porin [Methylophaga thiooxydans]|uniref:Phosphate-selective porin O and P superfamily n=1 Tax=Methylophaga thiooxydans DMS010 TaxID=637616 RepID=C0N6B8_9GAMM|nr:porin [Methylophaga thiooxydans]EEF79304.1 Phosphate-selective porin O and P superfamily [Methylophaga thiooxydans DMS010]
MKWKNTVLSAGMALAITNPAYAGSEIETLITMLHENGMVSEAQYGRLMAELEQNKTQAAEEKAIVEQKLAEATKPSDVEVTIDKGINIKTRDEKFTSKIGGRVQADAAAYGGEPDMGDGTEIRRARLYIQGTMYHDWGYKLQYDFVDTGSAGIKDAYLSYTGFDNLELKAGNFKDPFSLQEQTSSKFISFMERGLPSAFAAGRHIGVMASTRHQHWTLAGGLFGDTVSAKGGAEDEGWGAGTRATWAPVNNQADVIHLGLGLNYRETGGTNAARFKQQAESHISGINIVDTATIAAVNDFYKVGAEIATVQGPFSAQAEYITTSVNRDSGNDLDFDGWYAQAGYFLTGESRQYKNGKFGGITPKGNVGDGGIGAWELALRYSTIDLNDAEIEGGEADSVTLGVNWYPAPTLRFSANYVDVLDVDGGTNDGDEPSVFQVRSQWAF